MNKISLILPRLVLSTIFLSTQIAIPSYSFAVAKQPTAQKPSPKVQRYANLDEDLFPILVTNPPGGSTSNTPFLPPPSNTGGSTIGPIGGLPSLPTFPGGNFPGSFPGGGFSGGGLPATGGGIFGDNFGGGFGNSQIPSEFSCPLFETNPYESIFRALDAMNAAMKVTPACAGVNQNQQNQYFQNVQSNADSVRNSITALRAIQANPDILVTQSSQEIEALMQTAISAVNNISVSLSSNPILNNQCGKATAGKTLLAFNEILNNLAPIALVVAAANPAAGAATKLAMMGATMIPSAISQTAQFIKSNTVDITNPEIRKAILQNTCQFMKVYQKINFIRYKEEDNLGEIKNTLNTATNQYKQRYQSISSSSLLSGMRYKFDMEKALGELEIRIAQDRANLNIVNAKIRSLETDNERICFVGRNLVVNSRDAETFPASVVRNIEYTMTALESNNGGTGFTGFGTSSTSSTLPSLPGSTDSSALDSDGTNSPALSPLAQEAEELYLSYTKSRNRVSALANIVQNGTDPLQVDKAIALCGQEVKSWAKRITDSINFLNRSINSERVEIDQLLSVNADYKKWSREYNKLRSERKTVNTVTKVLREMSRDDAVFVRTELSQRASDLKNTLFNRTAGMLSKSPVEAWLQNNIDMHQNSISQFIHFLRLLQKGAGELTTTGGSSRAVMMGMGSTPEAPFAIVLNPQVWNDMLAEVNLTNINLKTIPKGSRKHEIACQQLRLGVVKYNEAKDYLGSAQFMCDMVDPVVSDTNSKIIQICRGSSTFNNTTPSTLEQFRRKMISKGANNQARSMADSLSLLKKRSKDLQCAETMVDIID